MIELNQVLMNDKNIGKLLKEIRKLTEEGELSWYLGTGDSDYNEKSNKIFCVSFEDKIPIFSSVSVHKHEGLNSFSLSFYVDLDPLDMNLVGYFYDGDDETPKTLKQGKKLIKTLESLNL